MFLVVAACGASPAAPPAPAVAPVAIAPDAAAVAPDAAVSTASIWRTDEIATESSVCAVRDDGHVWCWGDNAYGEVGDAPGVAHPVPIVVPGVTGATSIAMGPASACAIVDGGRVTCWGSFDAKLAAVHGVDGIADAVELAVTSARQCARKRDGEVWCWTNGVVSPQPPARIDALEHARRIVAGHAMLCALGTDDRVRCMAWYTRAGGGEGGAEIEVTDARGATALAGYFQSACAIVSGRVTCWTIMIDGVPRIDRVNTLDGIDDAIDLVSGLSHTCVARRRGGASCFSSWDHSAPADELRGYRALAPGQCSSCGVRADGSLWCWGATYGPLGRHSLRGARGVPVDTAIDAVEIAVERELTCARRKSGEVACWDAGQPTDVHVVADRLAAGSEFACAGAGGTTRCWGTRSWNGCRWLSGDNCQSEHDAAPTRVDGLLGIPHAAAIADPCALLDSGKVACRVVATANATTVEIAGVAHATAISAKCAALASGAVMCWRGAAPAAIGGVSDAVEVVSGSSHDCVRTRDGRVACWGANGLGQLGDGTRTSRDDPRFVGGLADVVQLAAGDAATCARTARGRGLVLGQQRGGRALRRRQRPRPARARGGDPGDRRRRRAAHDPPARVRAAQVGSRRVLGAHERWRRRGPAGGTRGAGRLAGHDLEGRCPVRQLRPGPTARDHIDARDGRQLPASAYCTAPAARTSRRPSTRAAQRVSCSATSSSRCTGAPTGGAVANATWCAPASAVGVPGSTCGTASASASASARGERGVHSPSTAPRW